MSRQSTKQVCALSLTYSFSTFFWSKQIASTTGVPVWLVKFFSEGVRGVGPLTTYPIIMHLLLRIFPRACRVWVYCSLIAAFKNDKKDGNYIFTLITMGQNIYIIFFCVYNFLPSFERFTTYITMHSNTSWHMTL